MNNGLYIGATGLRAQQSALDIVSNNIANMNTPAYKRSSVVFSELVSSPAETSLDKEQGPRIGNTGIGVAISDLPKVFSPGEYKKTDAPLDIAVRGNGFIELLGQNDETLLWRGGTMKVSKDALLTTADGIPLKGISALPQRTESIVIDERGRVFASIRGLATPREIGQIEIVSLQSNASLEALGEGTFKVKDPFVDMVRARPGDEGLGTVAQGFIEGSNVKITDEMVTLLLVQRSYGANARVIQAADELLSMTNGLKR